MTNQHSDQPASEHGLSEAAVDHLLRDFFRLEVPLALNNPVRPVTVQAAVVPAHRPAPASRIAIVAALAALTACLLLMSSDAPVASRGPGLAAGPLTVEPTEATLPVSSAPNADAGNVPVDEHGLLLRETEEIRLNPGR